MVETCCRFSLWRDRAWLLLVLGASVGKSPGQLGALPRGHQKVRPSSQGLEEASGLKQNQINGSCYLA